MNYLLYYIQQWGLRNWILKDVNNEGRLPYCFYYFIAIISMSFTDWIRDLIYGGDMF